MKIDIIGGKSHNEYYSIRLIKKKEKKKYYSIRVQDLERDIKSDIVNSSLTAVLDFVMMIDWI